MIREILFITFVFVAAMEALLGVIVMLMCDHDGHTMREPVVHLGLICALLAIALRPV